MVCTAAFVLGLILGVALARYNRRLSPKRPCPHKHFLQQLMDAIPAPIFFKDTQLIYRGCNKAFECALNRAKNAIVGRTAFDLAPMEMAQKYDTMDRALLQDSSVQTYESSIKFGDGTDHSVVFHKAVFADSTGTPAGIVGVIFDITDRKRAEDEMRESKIAAELASRAKNEFLSHMSHEIRTPLNGMIGMCDLVLEGAIDAEQREFITSAKSCGEFLLRIVGDILDFSKIEAGKAEIVSHPFQVRELVNRVLALTLVQAHAKQQRLWAETAEEIPELLLGDEVRLAQILTNFIGNAIKFTPNKGEISLEVSRHQADPELIEFTVSDTGPGIPLDKQANVFEPFYQVDNCLARKTSGTGLGLAISRRLATLMRGSISLESAPGAGAKFRLTVPLQTKLTD